MVILVVTIAKISQCVITDFFATKSAKHLNALNGYTGGHHRKNVCRVPVTSDIRILAISKVHSYVIFVT